MQKKYALKFVSLETPFKSEETKIESIAKLKTTIFMLLTLFGFSSLGMFGQTTVTYTTPGNYTFTVPCDVTSVTVQAWGGGGGGYGDDDNNNVTGRGGGGGAYTSATLVVTGGQVINFTVGAGGTAGSPTGGNGGSTTFLTLSAGGGVGGNVGAGGTGGIATGGTTNLNGGNSNSTGSSTTGATGGAGAGPGGGAGGAGGGDGTNGSAGATIGGGGGSSGDRSGGDENGGAGARGEIRITYTSALQAYCVPTFTSGSASITNVTFAGINNTTASAGLGSELDYYRYCDEATVVQGSPTNAISVKGNTYGNNTFHVRAYIDWNQDGDFIDANETYLIGTITNSTGLDALSAIGNISVPITANVGKTRMRVVYQFNSDPTNPCRTGVGYGQVEDYIVNVNAALPCVAPTAQPTALNLAPAGSTFSGSFTAALPAADSYLVLISTNPAAPAAPVDGTTYAIGSIYQAGYTVVDNDTNTSFVASGLTPLTTYYFYIYSFNSLCTGGPLYLGTSPLTGNATTLTADYCIPSYSNTFYPPVHYIRRVSFVGTLQDTDNPSSYDTTAPYGYEDFTGLTPSIQAQGEGVNIYMESTFSGYYKAWVDWNQDGDFLDAGEDVYDVGGIAQSSTTFGFIVPPATPPGNYRVRLRMSGRNGAFMGTDGGFAWDACTTNVAYSGEAEDYILTVVASCNSIITDVTDGVTCGAGTVDLAAVGSGGPSEFRWYTTETGGLPVATTATGNWTTPSIGTTTTYWVTCFNGCESLVRTKVIAYVNPVATISFTPSVPEVCGENNVLSLTAAGDVQQTFLVDEDFTSGLGVMTNQNIVSNGANNAITQWQTQTSTFVPAQQTWYPAISSGLSGNSFAMATSDVGPVTTHNAILSPTVDTNTYLNLTLSFDIFHSRYYVDGTNPTLEYITVDISTNGGGAWTEIDRYLADIGYGTRFENRTYDLSAYINEANFRVRIRYYGEWCDGLAIDNFQLFGDVPLNTAFDWAAGSPVDAFQDAACTIPYVSGTPIVTIYVRPNLTQLENTTYSFTATAVLSNGCSVSQNVSVDNKSKVWKGTSSNDWNDPNNWSPVGVPDITNCVIIPDVSFTNPSNIIGSNYNGFGKTLQVKDNGTLNVASGNTLTIQNFVEVGATGTFEIENSASLIQIDNVANTGNISMKRDVNIRKLDYVYWSSPVANYALNNISTTMYRYKWLPTIGANVNGWGNWALANENMISGKGYIVRGPDSFTATPQNYTQNFVGVPNNGTINMPISRGTYDGANYSTGVSTTLATKDDDNWNLIGNPYPSAISANTFLATNTNIAGFIKFWTHSNLPSSVITDPFYSDFVQNYTVGDYVTYNATGANPPIGNGNIAAGQGFFILMNHTSGSANENVVFDNSMRRNDYRNDLFYRNGNVTDNDIEEKNRIWLNLISPTLKSSTTLLGYITNATNELDRMYDAPALDVKTNFEIYSYSNSDKLNIQGKGLPFSNEDQIHLGVSIAENGIHSIGINKVDGLFESENQTIYLEDLQLGITHDLRNSPYDFMANIGRIENRFVLKFNNNTLGNEDFTSNSIVVFTNDYINVTTTNETIKSIKIHDLLGRVITEVNNVNSNTFMSKNISKTQSALLVEVTLENGAIKTFKVIY